MGIRTAAVAKRHVWEAPDVADRNLCRTVNSDTSGTLSIFRELVNWRHSPLKTADTTDAETRAKRMYRVADGGEHVVEMARPGAPLLRDLLTWRSRRLGLSLLEWRQMIAQLWLRFTCCASILRPRSRLWVRRTGIHVNFRKQLARVSNFQYP